MENSTGQVPVSQSENNLPINSQLPKKSRTPIIVGIIIALLLIAGSAFGYWQYQKKQTAQNSIVPVKVVTSQNNNQLQPEDAGYPTTTPVTQSTTTANQAYDFWISQKCDSRGPAVKSKSGMVEWQSPQPLSKASIFYSTTSPDSLLSFENDYLVGRFTSGKYSGADLMIVILTYNEPGLPDWYHVVKQGNNYVVLSKYSNSLPDPATDIEVISGLTEDKDFDLPDLDLPESLHLASPQADFTYAGNAGFFRNQQNFFCGDNYSQLFTDPDAGIVYTDAKSIASSGSHFGGFYVKAPDGTQVVYQLNIPITNDKNIPFVTWNSGKQNTSTYTGQKVGGCGATNFMSISNVTLSQLKPIGTALQGDTVYAYKDDHAQELQQLYDNIYVPDGQKKVIYGTFIAANPIFFWQDPFGDFVEFTSQDYQPMAECGKPVIYLYPQKTEKISVQISPQGGMTKSEPAYSGGWNVISDPYSNITNLADNQTYPYLFWEGRGGIYQTPDKGFVVAQADVHQFLINKLGLLGLTIKESGDFMDFWEPKMQGSPYYFVTFMGNDVMDFIAPLSVTPKPDTVIRILMDFKPLQNPISVQGYNIRTPLRKGFTVVEWGGVLR